MISGLLVDDAPKKSHNEKNNVKMQVPGIFLQQLTGDVVHLARPYEPVHRVELTCTLLSISYHGEGFTEEQGFSVETQIAVGGGSLTTLDFQAGRCRSPG